MYHYVTDEAPMDLNSFLKHFTPEERRRILLEEARKAGVVCVRLYVFDGNTRAQEVYARLGMHDARYRVLEQMIK